MGWKNKLCIHICLRDIEPEEITGREWGRGEGYFSKKLITARGDDVHNKVLAIHFSIIGLKQVERKKDVWFH